MTLEEALARIAELDGTVSSQKARISELNDEAKGHRLNATNARRELDAATAKHAEDLKVSSDKLTAAEASAKEAGTKANATLRDAALRLAAKDAGIVDMDGLKLLDTSKVTVADDGTVSIPDKFFETAREAKPFLFTQTGTQTGTTSQTQKTPPASTPTGKLATEMSPEEYAAARRAAISGR